MTASTFGAYDTTTIKISIMCSELDKNDTIKAIKKIKDYIVEDERELVLIRNGELFHGKSFGSHLDTFINWVEKNATTDEDGFIEFVNFSEYTDGLLPDLEEGDLEFSESIVITEDYNILFYAGSEYRTKYIKMPDFGMSAINAEVADVNESYNYFNFEDE